MEAKPVKNASSLILFSSHSKLETGLLPISCQKCSLAIFISFLLCLEKLFNHPFTQVPEKKNWSKLLTYRWIFLDYDHF